MKGAPGLDSWKRLGDIVDKEGSGDPNLFIPPDFAPDPGRQKAWSPRLNATQKLVFNDPSPVILTYGERGSGKTTVLLDCDVRHAYENGGALILIIVKHISAGAEGVLHDLENFVLPRWRDGNTFPEWLNGKPHPRAGQLMDEGLGIHFEPTAMDPLTKDRHIWVAANDGQWSKILLKSIPFGSQVDGRIRGPAPSRVHVEEITIMDGPEYLHYPAMQLSRRRGMANCPQQYTASCNPDGPSNWVYKEIIAPSVKEDGTKNEWFGIYHIPISENLVNLNPRYQEQLNQTIRDPYMRRRMIDGEWVDVPSGDAIFKDYFSFDIHVKGDALKGIGLLPIKGHPIIIGHDPGPKNYSITFEQKIPVDSETTPILWNVFDELNFVGQYKTYDLVAKDLASRIRYWIGHNKAGFNYFFQHIADEAAFTSRNSKGTFDALDMQREATKVGLKLKMLACPKGNDSQPQRVQMVVDYLLYEILHVSARCEKTIDMLRMVQSRPLKPGEYDPYAGLRINKHDPHRHSFDSMSYPMFRYRVRPGTSSLTGEVEKSKMFWAGGSS